MRWVRIYKAGIHHGEESIILGNERSGLVNFSGCHLSCRFCYTPESSVHRFGTDYDPQKFEVLVSDLLKQGAQNLNLVSPSHEWLALEEMLGSLKSTHPDLLIILKTSGYESRRLVQRMAAFADVWVPDYKVHGAKAARTVNLPGNYGEIAEAALRTMMETHVEQQFNEERKLTRGILVRHLLMPGFLEDSIHVVETLGSIGFQGHLNLLTHFLDPISRQIRIAPQDHIELLTSLAERTGITVLTDGLAATTAGQPAKKGKATYASLS